MSGHKKVGLGRTGRMLVGAIAKAKKGASAVVVTHSQAHARELSRLVAGMLADDDRFRARSTALTTSFAGGGSVRVVSVADERSLDRLRGLSADICVDHYLEETASPELKHQLDALVRAAAIAARGGRSSTTSPG